MLSLVKLMRLQEFGKFASQNLVNESVWLLLKREESSKTSRRQKKSLKKCQSKKKLLAAATIVLKAYAENKMLAKEKELVKQMCDDGCRIGPITWDVLVKLYVEVGEVEKADSVLEKAAQQSPQKLMFSSYMTVLDRYADRGDVHNSEKIFYRMREVGYVPKVRPFQSLLRAYMNAKVPAYGFRERMQADSIFPNKALAAQLSYVDVFKKTLVSDLLN